VASLFTNLYDSKKAALKNLLMKFILFNKDRCTSFFGEMVKSEDYKAFPFVLLFTLFFTGYSFYLSAQPPSSDYKLLFEENFDGNSVNEKDWVYRLDRRQGGSFNALNLKKNVSVSGGLLHIEVRQDTIHGVSENTGGGLISKYNFGYGYYESLSKPFMEGTGVHSAFWQAGGANPEVVNRVFEIDSYEIDSKTFLGDNNLYVHICPKEFSEVPWPHRAKIPLKFREDGWLLDAFEYTPEGVIFYDNGKMVAKAECSSLVAAQKIWLTALNGFGKVEKEKQPGETLFDYFRFYAKAHPGANILPNGSFEYNQDKVDPSKPVAWYANSTENAVRVVHGDASSGNYLLKLGTDERPFSAEIRQELEFIVNGKYNLTAKVRSSGGLDKGEIVINGFGGEEVSRFISASAGWKLIEIKDIPVSNNRIGISILAAGDSGKWVEMDDMQLMVPAIQKERMENKPLVLIGDPIWQLAKAEPIVFSGDDKFYFFDRNVGYGDAITISFRIKPDLKGNMTPISRMPKEGKSGWAVQLTENGAVNFRIGSQADNFCLSAPDAYTTGKECLITCVFHNGVAEIALNGRIVATRNGIKYNTRDKTAAGRLGDTQTSFQSIAEVFIPENITDNSGPIKSGKLKFKGAIRNVRIYNRAISEDEVKQLVNR
jgi:hypothetical protein